MLRPLVTGEQMQRIERAVIDRGLTSLALMEVAARAVADAAEVRFDPARHRAVVALAGPGNNGGDAIAAARLLRDRGLPVRAVMLADPARASGDLLAQLALFGPVERAAPELSEALVIDGLFGTGLSRALEPPYLALVERLSRPDPSRAVVAVDIPSGVHAGTGQVLGAAVAADVTVTFQVPKLGHYLYPGRQLRGELVVADIGLPLAEFAGGSTELVGDDAIEAAFPVRNATGHKGSYGHLLVVAGARARPGSALLAGRAALRSGAGLVTVASDRETIARVAPALDELMGLEAGDGALDPNPVLAALDRKTALLVGPSLSEPDDMAIRTIVHGAPIPAVIDAGALHTLAADPSVLRARAAPTVLTPHPGEMSALCGAPVAAVERDRVGAAVAYAAAWGVIVVLKGASTVVADPSGRAAIVPTGNPGLGTAGTGDVLGGVLAGLLAQRHDPWVAATAAPYVHGRAGDRARDRVGEASLVASDVVAALGEVIAEATRARAPWTRGTWPSTRRGAPRGHAP